MVDRINANAASAASYVSGSVFGTGYTEPTLPCPASPPSAHDQCEWSLALKGAAEKKSTTNLGAMSGARGCITQIQAQDTTPTVCTPGIYLVSVAWQGFNASSQPVAACGSGLYGNESLRRIVSARVVVGLPGCS
jgi:type IV pilus assembly protein PilV